jgi:hypothetical protein
MPARDVQLELDQWLKMSTATAAMVKTPAETAAKITSNSLPMHGKIA